MCFFSGTLPVEQRTATMLPCVNLIDNFYAVTGKQFVKSVNGYITCYVKSLTVGEKKLYSQSTNIKHITSH